MPRSISPDTIYLSLACRPDGRTYDWTIWLSGTFNDGVGGIKIHAAQAAGLRGLLGGNCRFQSEPLGGDYGAGVAAILQIGQYGHFDEDEIFKILAGVPIGPDTTNRTWAKLAVGALDDRGIIQCRDVNALDAMAVFWADLNSSNDEAGGRSRNPPIVIY